MQRTTRASEGGFTILEAVIAGTIMALFMAGLFQMSGRNVQMLKSGKESFAATIVLEERMEQLRSGKWSDITSVAYLQTILAAAPASSGSLSGLSEQISVSAYPPAATPAASNTVARSAAGAVTVLSSNPALSTTGLVRADLRAAWSGTPGRRPRVREISTVIANRGLITR